MLLAVIAALWRAKDDSIVRVRRPFWISQRNPLSSLCRNAFRAAI